MFVVHQDDGHVRGVDDGRSAGSIGKLSRSSDSVPHADVNLL